MPEPWILVTEAALDDAAARRFVAAPSNGAVLVFHGVVRDRHEGRAVTRVEYSAYEAMAESELREVARETAREHGVEHLAVFHRLGPVAVGEASLVVAVGSPHRAAAFACGLATIDRLKARAPVFKKEIGPDGARWQEGVLPEPAP